MIEVQGPDEGRRERKKRLQREAIAATARGLFAERGYDAVTVAEVAAAADVSEKTVFNHFPTKEDLAFADRGQQHARLLAAVTGRPPGTPVLAAFRAATRALTDDLDDPGWAAIVHGSRTLQERLAAGWEDEAAALTEAIGHPVVARALYWTHRSIQRQGLLGLHAGEDRRKLATRLRREADRAYDLLARGLRDFGA